MATNITERVIKLITLDNQLISMVEDQGFLCHLEFLNPRCALPSLHYITLTPLSSYNVPVCSLGSWVSYSRACKTGNRGDAEHVWNRQARHPHNFTWQLKEYEQSSGWHGGSVSCVSHTSAAVHEGLLSQCSVTDSPANTRKVKASVGIAYAE